MKTGKKTRLLALIMALGMMTAALGGCGGDKDVSSAKGNNQIVDVDDEDFITESGGEGTQNPDGTQGGDGDVVNTNDGDKTGPTGEKVTPIKLGNIDLGGRTIVVYDHNRKSTGLINDKTTEMGKALQERIAAIEKKYNCKWQWGTDSYETMTASIAANTPNVDIMDIGGAHQFPGFYTANFLTPMETFPDSISLADSRYLAQTTNGTAVNGLHYAVYYKPQGIDAIGDTFALYLNKTLLQKAGVNVDDLYAKQNNNQWTWAAFEEVCAKIKAAGSIPVEDTSAVFYRQMLISNGADLITKSGASITSATFSAGSEKGKVAMNQYLDWFKKGYITTNASSEADKNNFIQGKTGFTVDYINRIYAPDGGYAGMKDDFAFLRMPHGPSMEKSVMGRDWFFGLTIPRGVKNPEVIADILAMYCEPLLSSAENTRVLTAQLARYTRDKNSADVLRTLPSNTVYSPTAYFTEMDWTTKYMPAITSGQKTPDAAYAEVTDMYNQMIKDLFTKK